MGDVGILMLRMAVGAVIVCHALYKFRNKRLFDAKWRQDYGFPPGSVLVTAIVQLGAGVAIIAGAFGRLAALVLLVVMGVATYVCIVKHREPFLSTPDGKGWDINVLLMGALLALALTGDGKWALVH